MNVKRRLVVAGVILFLAGNVIGCADSSTRQVQETSAMSFEEAAARIDQENSTSEVTR
jgi:hypothetical protein